MVLGFFFFFPTTHSWATGLKHQPVATRRFDPVHQRALGSRAPTLLSSWGSCSGTRAAPSGSRRGCSILPRQCPGGAAGTPPAGAGNAKGRGEAAGWPPCPWHLSGAGGPGGAPRAVPRPGGAPPGWGRLERVKRFPSSCCSPLNATAFL